MVTVQTHFQAITHGPAIVGTCWPIRFSHELSRFFFIALDQGVLHHVSLVISLVNSKDCTWVAGWIDHSFFILYQGGGLSRLSTGCFSYFRYCFGQKVSNVCSKVHSGTRWTFMANQTAASRQATWETNIKRERKNENRCFNEIQPRWTLAYVLQKMWLFGDYFVNIRITITQSILSLKIISYKSLSD